MDIGGLEVIGTGSRLLTAEDVTEVTKHIEQLEVENAKLQDENARLRSCLSDDAENARMIMGENAKLQELIVRCCGCASAREHYEGMDVWWCEYLQMYVGPDGFCSWGIRRDYEEGK